MRRVTGWQGRGNGTGSTVEERADDAAGTIPDVDVSDYSVVPMPDQARHRKGRPQFGVLDMAGHIRVTDPALLVARIAGGFGRAPGVRLRLDARAARLSAP